MVLSSRQSLSTPGLSYITNCSANDLNSTVSIVLRGRCDSAGPCQQPDPQTWRVLQSEHNQPPHYRVSLSATSKRHPAAPPLLLKILDSRPRQVCFKYDF